jgi:hypothetical protein
MAVMIRALLVASLLFGGVASAATSGSKKPTATQKDPKHTAQKSATHKSTTKKTTNKTTKVKTQKARSKPATSHTKARSKPRK